MGCCCVMVILIQTVKYQWPSNNLQLDIIITPPGKKKRGIKRFLMQWASNYVDAFDLCLLPARTHILLVFILRFMVWLRIHITIPVRRIQINALQITCHALSTIRFLGIKNLQSIHTLWHSDVLIVPTWISF